MTSAPRSSRICAARAARESSKPSVAIIRISGFVKSSAWRVSFCNRVRGLNVAALAARRKMPERRTARAI